MSSPTANQAAGSARPCNRRSASRRRRPETVTTMKTVRSLYPGVWGRTLDTPSAPATIAAPTASRSDRLNCAPISVGAVLMKHHAKNTCAATRPTSLTARSSQTCLTSESTGPSSSWNSVLARR